MSTNTVIPLSIQSGNSFSNQSSQIVLGSGKSQTTYSVPGTKNNLYWVMILDRTSLKPVVNTTFSSNDVVPADISKYGNDDTKIIIVCTHNLFSPNLPQGAWAKFLYQQGASTQLTRIEQIYESFNCGQWGRLSYIYVAILGDESTNGFDMSAVVGGASLMTLSLQNFGSTQYSPTSLVLPTP